MVSYRVKSRVHSKIGALNYTPIIFFIAPNLECTLHRWLGHLADEAGAAGQAASLLTQELSTGFTSRRVRFHFPRAVPNRRRARARPQPNPAASGALRQNTPQPPMGEAEGGAREMAAASAGGRRSPAAPPHRAAPPGPSGPCHVPLTTPAPTHSRPSNRPRRGSAAPPAGRAAGTAPRPS